jgi:hypothetical protein
VPINFEHNIHTLEGTRRFQIVVEPNREKISIIFKNNDVKIEPEIFSNSYSVEIEN